MMESSSMRGGRPGEGWLVTLLLALAACGGGANGGDGGPTTVSDAGSDGRATDAAALDGRADASSDAAGDGAVDASRDASGDASSGDGGVDAAGDARADDGGLDASGDGAATDGAMGAPCIADGDCDDGDECNGVEICVDGRCAAGTSPDCDDENACTVDTCVPGSGCVNLLLDRDGDGQASTTLGACGTDCDDARSDVHVGAPDTCDGVDNDCDGTTDEDEWVIWYVDCDGDGFAASGAATMGACDGAPPGDATGCPGGAGSWTATPPEAGTTDCDDSRSSIYEGAPETCDSLDNDCDGATDEDLAVYTWYADCDGDNYAAAGAAVMDWCAEPDASLTGCPGGGGRWTIRAPGANTTDCNDANGSVHPGQRDWFTEPIPGASAIVDFDYDCSGTEERFVGAGGCDTTPRGCRIRRGFIGSLPECGETGTRVDWCRYNRSTGTCEPAATSSYRERCH